jgi:hypothetical protein
MAVYNILPSIHNAMKLPLYIYTLITHNFYLIDYEQLKYAYADSEVKYGNTVHVS